MMKVIWFVLLIEKKGIELLPSVMAAGLVTTGKMVSVDIHIVIYKSLVESKDLYCIEILLTR